MRPQTFALYVIIQLTLLFDWGVIAASYRRPSQESVLKNVSRRSGYLYRFPVSGNNHKKEKSSMPGVKKTRNFLRKNPRVYTEKEMLRIRINNYIDFKQTKAVKNLKSRIRYYINEHTSSKSSYELFKKSYDIKFNKLQENYDDLTLKYDMLSEMVDKLTSKGEEFEEDFGGFQDDVGDRLDKLEVFRQDEDDELKSSPQNEEEDDF